MEAQMRLSNIKKTDTDLRVDLEKENAPNELTRGLKVEVLNLPIHKIKPYRYQARVIFDDDSLLELAETIRDHGVRQPLTVLRIDGEEFSYEVVSGERRLKAALIADLQTVPCIVIEDEIQAQELSLIENVQRKDLHAIELWKAIEAFHQRNPNLSVEDVYRKLGISKAQFYRMMSLAKLTDEVKDYALKHNIPANLLYEVSKIEVARQMEYIIRKFEGGGSNTIGHVMDRITKSKTKVFEIYMKEGMLLKNINLMAIPFEKKNEVISMLKDLINTIEHDS